MNNPNKNIKDTKPSKEKQSDALQKNPVNEQIRSDKIIVIDHLGQQLGALPRSQALNRAFDAGLDLVQVGEREGLPVAKFMDYGKVLYTKKKQLSDAKKNQKIIIVKEIKIRPNIGEQDYKTKLNHAVAFFKEGNKVKFTLQFRGREASMMSEVGPRLFARISADLAAQNVGQLVEEKDTRSHMLWTKIFHVKTK